MRTPTPVEHAQLGLDLDVYLKREDLGPNAAFKWRGALTACEALRRGGATGVVTASTGNAGAGVAWAATRVGIAAHVVLPESAREVKRDLITRHGAALHPHGRTMSDATAHAVDLARELDLPIFEDGMSPDQLLGTATVGEELDQQVSVDTVIVPVACGALAGSLAGVLKQRPRPPRVIGVQSIHFSRLRAAFKHEPYVTTGSNTIADGLADDRIVEPAFGLCRAYLDEIVAVDDEQIADAIRRLAARTGIVAEGAGAAPLAALLAYPETVAGRRVALVLTGGNLGPDLQAAIISPRNGRRKDQDGD